MALPTVKTTYTVDADTKRALDRLAERWAVSRSAALRRAIRQAAASAGVDDRLRALDLLQSRAGMTASAAARWSNSVRTERRQHRSGGRVFLRCLGLGSGSGPFRLLRGRP